MKKILSVLTIFVLSLAFIVCAYADFLDEEFEACEGSDSCTARYVSINSVVTEDAWIEKENSYSSRYPFNANNLFYIIEVPTKGRFNIVVDGSVGLSYWVTLYDSNGKELNDFQSVGFGTNGKGDKPLSEINSITLNPGRYGIEFNMINEQELTYYYYANKKLSVTISFGFDCPHEAGEWVTIDAGDCENKGERAKYCKHCDTEMEREETGFGDHDYGKWTEARAATEERDGLRVRECDICGKEEEDTIDKLVHGASVSKVTVNATCTEDGANNKICKYCNEIIESEVILAKGHNVSKWKTTKEPTAISNGIESGTCKTCKQTVEREIPNDPTLPIDPSEPVPYDDVEKDKWYYDTVLLVYINHYMVGPSPTKFNPSGNITIAEAITVATRIFSANAGEKVEKLETYLEKNPAESGEPWYQPYVEYAIINGIIKEGDFESYSAVAKRSEMAYIFAHCAEMEQINETESIPDVAKDDKYGEEIYYLYNAGILAGNDAKGTFTPDREITRAEVSALIARITKLSDRVKK